MSTTFDRIAIEKTKKISNISLNIFGLSIVLGFLGVILLNPILATPIMYLGIPALLVHIGFGLRLVWLVKMKHKWLILFSLALPIITLWFLHVADKKAKTILTEPNNDVAAQKHLTATKSVEPTPAHKRKYCIDCGVPLALHAKYCGQCGTVI